MAQQKTEELLAVAYLARPHGVHGEISAINLAPKILDPVALFVGTEFLTRKQSTLSIPERLRVTALRPHQDRLLLTFDNIHSMDDANRLRGVDLCLFREQLPKLPDDWYWDTDLQQCRVIDKTLGDVGTANGLNLDLRQPYLEVLSKTGEIALIPWVRAFITKVDLSTQEILVDLPADFPGISSSLTKE